MAFIDQRRVAPRRARGAFLVAALFAAAVALIAAPPAMAGGMGGGGGGGSHHGGGGWHGGGHQGFHGRHFGYGGHFGHYGHYSHYSHYGHYGHGYRHFAHRGFGHRFYGRHFYHHGFYGHGYYARGYGYRYGYGYGGCCYGGYVYPYLPYGSGYPYIVPGYVPPVYVTPPPEQVVMTAPPQPMAEAPPAPQQFEVYFDFDRYDLTPEGRRVVDAAIDAARQGAAAEIDVTGNTDLAGTAAYNVVLSKRRAETVRRYMVAHGIGDSEISVHWLGKSNPAVRTADGVRDPRNRRVEIVITPEGDGQAPAVSMAEPPYGQPTPLVPRD